MFIKIFKMKIYVLIFLLVIQVIQSEKAVSKIRKKLIVPKINEKCKKIKCPSIEEPQCVKMRRQDLGITLHIVAANKCELDYIKCYDDVEAKVVPMKYCGHNAVQTTGNKNKTGKPHIRVKRRVKSASKEVSRQGEETNKFRGKPKKKSSLEMKRARILSKKLALLQRNNKVSNIITKYSVLNDLNQLKRKKLKPKWRLDTGYPLSSETGSDFENNERKKLKKGFPGYRLSFEEEEPSSFQGFMAKSSIAEPQNSENEEKEQKRLWFQGIEMVSEEEGNDAIKMNDVDKQQYEAACPEVCPSRNVMVCAKCQHGIYKTFMSTCHMRMFTCEHPDEELELVSRFPCIQSGPYLAQDRMKPKGWIAEAEDDDTIQRYLICQATGGLRKKGNKTVDPRCQFRLFAKTNLKFYDFKGVNVQIGNHLVKSDTSEY